MDHFAHLDIVISDGFSKNGAKYAYVRPSEKCDNKSRKVLARNIDNLIKKHYPVVRYYKVDGYTIGAKNKQFALGEYWRICERPKIGKAFDVLEMA